MVFGWFLWSLIWFNYPVQTGSWELRKEKDGIKIFTRKVEGYNIQEFRGVTEVEASAARILRVLKDVENYNEWIFNCTRSELVERVEGKTIFYSAVKVPFPVTDRDLVQQMRIHQLGQDYQTIVNSIPNYLPEKKGFVRIPVSNGGWKLKQLENGHTRVEMQFLNDPGGSIPDWIVNMLLTDSPLKSLVGLKEQVKKAKYD